MKKTTMTGYRLLTLALLIVAVQAGVGCSSSDSELKGSAEEIEYDRLQLKGDWKQIVETYSQHPSQSLACHKVAQLARFQLKQVGNEAVFECLANSREVLSSPRAAIMMSDVYIQLGMVNMAQRAAFESMVKETDVKKCGRALRRLTETAIITRQYEVARKYIAILEENNMHRDFARSMLTIVEHPELISENPVYLQLRKTYDETNDQFFL